MLFDALVALVTLTAMEIVLGIDNIIFLAILVGRLPPPQQPLARRLGLGVALGTRLLLLCLLSVLLQLNAPLFRLTSLGVPAGWLRPSPPAEVQQLGPEAVARYQERADEEFEKRNGISLRDLILIAGGLFLVAKSTYEIHDKLEGGEHAAKPRPAGQFAWVIVQVAVIDIVFSLDSVITAIGMARDLWVMVVAMILAVGVMLVASGYISRLVERHPTLKILALSFLILIGVMLMAEGIEKHIERGYIYFAMAFSVVVELLNLRFRSKGTPVQLHGPPPAPKPAS